MSAAEKTPTTIKQTVALKSKPASGKLIVSLDCGEASCTDVSNGVKAAAGALGWNFKQLSFTLTNPTSLITAMQQALQYHPYAVTFTGQPQALWSSEVAAYKKAGVLIILAAGGPVTISPTTPVSLGDFTQQGEELGNWFASDSGGSGSALVVNFPFYPSLGQYATGIQQAVAAGCTGCKVSTLNGTVNELSAGTLLPAIVSAVKKNPKIKYVLSVDDLLTTGLPAAFQSAGLTGGSHPG